MMAAIAPSPGGTASCIARPRARTRRTASSSESAPAATSAEYSPSEWPAAKRGAGSVGYRSRSAARTAALIVTIAGCAFAVSVSSLLGAFEDQLRERAASPGERRVGAREHVARGGETTSRRSLPMPTTWEPWPGKSHAT